MGACIMGILSLFAASAGISGLVYGEREPALLMIGICIYLGTGAAFVLSARSFRRRVSFRSVALQAAGPGGRGTAIFYSRGMHYLLAGALLMTFPLAATVAAGGLLEQEAGVDGVEVNLVDTVAFGSLALMSLWFSIGLLRGLAGERRPRLVLSPDGIYHRSYTFEHFVPWEDVFAVTAEDFRGPVIAARAFESKSIWTRRSMWAFLQDEPRYVPDLKVRSRLLALDPVVAYHALRFYHAHPDARIELLTSGAEQRIRCGNLVG
jgi:hypothetical protein